VQGRELRAPRCSAKPRRGTRLARTVVDSKTGAGAKLASQTVGRGGTRPNFINKQRCPKVKRRKKQTPHETQTAHRNGEKMPFRQLTIRKKANRKTRPKRIGVKKTKKTKGKTNIWQRVPRAVLSGQTAGGSRPKRTG